MVGLGEFCGYAQVSDGVVYVYGHDQGRYQTVRVDRDQESEHLECDLTPWAPTKGERVAEINNEECVTGTILEAGERTALVRWNGFVEPQVWLNADLEPVWTEQLGV
jgi:hypothetical protein